MGRRYRRLLAEGKPLPDLVLIDGGKGQLSAALKAIQAAVTPAKAGVQSRPVLDTGFRRYDDSIKIHLPFAVAALAKREEELFLPDREEPILLPRDSAALHLVQHVRDEAHRFAVTFHRQRRAKQMLH